MLLCIYAICISRGLIALVLFIVSNNTIKIIYLAVRLSKYYIEFKYLIYLNMILYLYIDSQYHTELLSTYSDNLHSLALKIGQVLTLLTVSILLVFTSKIKIYINPLHMGNRYDNVHRVIFVHETLTHGWAC